MNAAHQQGSEATGYQLHVAQALLPRRAFENRKAHHEGECAAVGLDMGPAPRHTYDLQRHLSHVRRKLTGANFRHAFFKW